MNSNLYERAGRVASVLRQVADRRAEVLSRPPSGISGMRDPTFDAQAELAEIVAMLAGELRKQDGERVQLASGLLLDRLAHKYGLHRERTGLAGLETDEALRKRLLGEIDK